MLDNFRKYLEGKFLLTDHDFELISKHCLINKLHKKQYLLRAGDLWNRHAFISKGFLKMFCVGENGQEHILQFAPENYWTGDRESVTTGLPAKYNIDAIEQSEVVLMTNEHFEMLRKAIPAFNEFVNDTINKNVFALQERIHVNITSTAEEKYTNFIRQFPDIANRVPLHMIASYLGTSAETLSRIRSQSVKK